MSKTHQEFFAYKGGNYVINNLILTSEEIDKLGVGFSKKEIQSHKGIAGLKYYLVVMYLRLHIMPVNILPTTLSKLITRCGYSASTRRTTTYDDWRNIIYKLIADGYLTCSQDIMTVKPTEEFVLTFSHSRNLFFTDDSFVFITKKEFDAITSYKTNMNKSVIIGVFIYIKQFIIDADFASGIAYPSKHQIARGIGISSATTIEKAINILVDLNLLYVKSDFYIEDTTDAGSYIPTSNVYTLRDDIDIKVYLKELENKYSRPVYTKNTVPGRIKFLS